MAALLAQPTLAQMLPVTTPDEYKLTLLARPESILSDKSPGHTFFCITAMLSSGPKEECFGFYPTGHGYFGDPGTLNNEFTRASIQAVTESLELKMTPETRAAVYATIKQWAGADYHIALNNCGDFVFAVAKAAGMDLPQRSEVTRPVDFVRALRTRYWYGSWTSSDAQRRFTLRIGTEGAVWVERSATGVTISRSVTPPSGDAGSRIERPNDDAVLTFLGFQAPLRAEILAKGAQPSYLALRRVGPRIEAEWFGLIVTKDDKAHLKEIVQPGSRPAKPFTFDRS